MDQCYYNNNEKYESGSEAMSFVHVHYYFGNREESPYKTAFF